MKKTKYDTDNPRKLVNIRLKTLQQIIDMYPKINTHQKRIQQIIKDLKKRQQ